MKVDYDVVHVPRAVANEDAALLIGWTRNDGEQVAADDVICELEFSKAVVELPAPRGGWLFHARRAGDEVAVGTPLAMIADRPERPDLQAAAEVAGGNLTAKARRLIEAHGLDVAQFQGIDIVREKHVLAVIEAKGSATDATEEGELTTPSPARRRAAKALTHSKQTIPHSHLCRLVAADPIDARVEHLAGRHDIMLSVAEWLVATVAREAAAEPRVNASWRPDGIFVHARINVGYALNQANGDLLVPVVADADRLALDELVGRLRGLQKKALRHRLAPEELSGGTITVTSMIGSGAHQVFPILVPGQAAIVAIGDRCELGAAASYALTIGFDHRVLNGSEAATFLAAVAAGLEGEG